jgi:hypothetical protein
MPGIMLKYPSAKEIFDLFDKAVYGTVLDRDAVKAIIKSIWVYTPAAFSYEDIIVAVTEALDEIKAARREWGIEE